MATILYADDDDANRRALVTLLKLAGYDAVGATSAEEALAYLEFQRPDLLLLDHVMPGIGGVDALGVIRARPRFRSLPVIVYTARDDADLRERAGALNAEIFTKTRISAEGLIRAIRRKLTCRVY